MRGSNYGSCGYGCGSCLSTQSPLLRLVLVHKPAGWCDRRNVSIGA